jgi:TonB family protein
MANATQEGKARLDPSPGHLSVHVEGAHPDEVPFLFEQRQTRVGPALAASLVWHAALVAVFVLAFGSGSDPTEKLPAVAEALPSGIVWLAVPGPGGGGGGGGNRKPEPPRRAELPGKDRLTVPVTTPPKVEIPKQVKDEPEPLAQLNIPAATLADSTDSLPGAIDAPSAPASVSQGSGQGGGAGTGSGSGVGSGTGSGLGPGYGGGTGGGAYRPGSGVSTPRVLVEVKPEYTADAMRARIQGAVWIQCVVQTSGQCTDVQVIRPLDPTFGLDQQAIAAARQWRFAPGTLRGEPVPVLVTIELTFTLR